MKNRKRQMTKGIEQIRTVGEKGTYKYLGILEADTIKHVYMTEKNLKNNTSWEQENYSKPN